MKIRCITAVRVVTAVFLFTQMTQISVYAQKEAAENVQTDIPQFVDMVPVTQTETEPENLYALSAVLMDGDSGRVLYEKEGETARANASTTKVMTCILALETAPGDDYVQVSANAAAQPDVQLDIREGEQYYLEDLLYSLMLKSHNDTAVAIAEHCGGSVEGFARMMNRKAKELGCTDTYFITPNGLDATEGAQTHHTTARDLALIMRYAIRNKTFRHICQTRDYTFSDISGKRTFSLHNANALLDMMDGVIAGKTGYTSLAGYCYVCAWESNGRTFIVSLLGCGWPNHKTYKWSDTRKLLEYGADNYEYRTYWTEPQTTPVLVKDGVLPTQKIGADVYLRGKCSISSSDRKQKILMKAGEEAQCQVQIKTSVQAPVLKGEKLGQIVYVLGEKKLAVYPVYAEKDVEKISFGWYAQRVFHDFFH